MRRTGTCANSGPLPSRALVLVGTPGATRGLRVWPGQQLTAPSPGSLVTGKLSFHLLVT